MRERMQGIGMELVKVIYLFSLVTEVLVCGMAALTNDTSLMAPMLGLLVIPALSVLFRRCIRNFVLFFLAHVAMFGVIFLYPNLLSRVAAGAFIASDMIYIYVRKTSGSNDPMSVAQLVIAFGVALVMYIVSGQVDITFVRPFIITMFIIHITVYMIYFHELNVQESLEANSESLNQSTRKIGNINNKIIIIYVVIMLILIGAGVLLRMDVVITMIGQLLYAALRFVVRLFAHGGGSEGSQVPVDVPEASGGDDAVMMNGEANTFMFWLVVEKIVIAVCLIVALIGLGYALYRFYQKFTKDRIEERQTGEYEETTVFVEKAEKVRKERQSLFEYLNLSNEKRVRRLYAKRVQKQIKAGAPVKPSQTVQEIQSVVQEDLTALSTLYEKARYSNQLITKEEVKGIE